ncbi:hypothetical protein RYX36_027956, partial [Vicia faba]
DDDSLLSIAISALALPGVFCLSVTNGRIVTHPQGRLLAGWQKEYWHVSGFVIRNLTEVSTQSSLDPLWSIRRKL